MFTWIPIHREAIHKILEYRENQAELLTALREMEQKGLKVISLRDEGVDGHKLPLAEIDPFSFMATFNRGMTDKNRRENWAFLKTRWGLSAAIPDDFQGIPILNSMVSRFFPQAKEREQGHVDCLWQVAGLAVDGGIEKLDEKSFNRCLELKTVGIGSLTIGLFWINPEKFLPADSKTKAYGKAKGVTAEPEDCRSYRQWMKEMTEQVNSNYPQVSHEAHVFAVQGKKWHFAKWLGPVLDALRTLGGSGTPKAVLQKIQEILKLPDAVFSDKNKSGQPRFYNEVHWARQYLVWEGLLDGGKRGVWALTEKGTQTILDDTQAQAIVEKWAEIHKQSGDAADDDPHLQGESEKSEIALHDAPTGNSTRQYWTMCVGDGVELWNEFKHQGVIAIDYVGIRDITQYETKEAIAEDLKKLYPSGTSKRNDSLACWQFCHTIKKGDLVFVNRGFTTLLGCAEVLDDYRFDDNKPTYQHIRRVKWLKDGLWTLADHCKPANKSLTEITGYEDFVAQLLRITEQGNSTIQHWWLNANPKIWNFEETPVGQRQTYTSHNEKGNKRRIYDYFQAAKPGDLVVGYVTSPQKEVVAVCKITKGLHQTGHGEQIEFEKVEQLIKPIAYETLQANPDLANCEPLISNQGSLFKLTEQEYEIIRSLIDETNIEVKTKIESYTTKQAMKELFLAEVQFDEMLDALKEKKNLVLQGAPGVGKTFIAKRLAYTLIGFKDPQRVEMIQFHQSYSYEDFIQGFRPTPKGTFDLKLGIFHQFCRRAQRDEAQGKPYVFIIDEINRGNLSKIFGELMMLIEPDKRGKEHAIPLAYSQDADEKFYIPENLHLIGMMNTADRSLAMVDYALRRRFRFIMLRPEFASAAFQESLTGAGAKPELVKKIVSRMKDLNEVIAADTKNLGPGYQIGHSYFCPRNGIKPDDDWYGRVVESEIVPLIQEYWFDNEQKVKEQRSALLA